jgi:hypothetical protein
MQEIVRQIAEAARLTVVMNRCMGAIHLWLQKKISLRSDHLARIAV